MYKEVRIRREKFSHSIVSESCIAKKLENPNSGYKFGHIKSNFLFSFLGHRWKNCSMRIRRILLTAKLALPVCISQLIIILNDFSLDSFYLHYMGWIKSKNHLTLVPVRTPSRWLSFNANSFKGTVQRTKVGERSDCCCCMRLLFCCCCANCCCSCMMLLLASLLPLLLQVSFLPFNAGQGCSRIAVVFIYSWIL